MAGRKREKELARAKYARQSGRRDQRALRQRRVNIGIGIAVVVAVVAALVGIAITVVHANANSTAEAPATPTPSAAPTTAPSPTSAATPSPTSPSASTAPAACASASPTAKPTASFASAPAKSGTLPTTLTLATNCGDIVIALDPKAPITVGSEAFLAGQHFYDGTACHRLTTQGIFVLQCGDPKGDGTGGPGYTIPDENLPSASGVNYPAGTVAMANAGANTGGSQFFLVYQDTTLPPGYSIWGRVTTGLDTLKAIAAAGTANGTPDGPPAQPVVIKSATISG